MNKGRIIKGVGGLYFVADGTHIYECSARGKFRKSNTTPTVGDYVNITIIDEQDKKGTIETIEKRKNILLRPKVSNIDTAVITFAGTNPSINFDLLDRFLLMAQTQNIDDIIICINKSDLIKAEDKEYITRIYSRIYNLIFTSVIEDTHLDNLRAMLKGKVCVFAGPSGVGKSSIINTIIPNMNRQTGEISKKIKRGKHTTREVELMAVDNDTYIVDSPGFTSLNLDFLKPEELQFYFKEFSDYLGKCAFTDCAHIHEPNCAIKENIGNTIAQERYDRFVYLFKELSNSR